MKAIHKKRLLKAAKLVDELPSGLLDMRTVGDGTCGTPACVWGHYKREHPRAFPDALGVMDGAVEHFGIEWHEAVELFKTEGCGNAKTGKQAAKYIRAFVKRKETANDEAMRSASNVATEQVNK